MPRLIQRSPAARSVTVRLLSRWDETPL